MKHYVAAGFDPAAFWCLTPRLYAVHMEGARMRLAREARDTAWAVWHVAALGRAKKMPRLQEFVPDRPRGSRGKPPPWQGQLAAWAAYAARQQP